MKAPAPLPVLLRTAAVWGTTVLAVRALRAGESLEVGDRPTSIVASPDGAEVSNWPIRAVGAGWELDARGATGGVIRVRGREEDPAELARSGAPIPIVAGDHGIILYGSFGIFFQFSPDAPPIKTRRHIDWAFVFAFLFAVVTIVGGLGLLAVLTTPRSLEKPVELTSAEQLAVQFMMDEEIEPPKPESGSDKGKGIKDPGAKDKKEQGGGKKAKGPEGRLGKQGPEEDTKMEGEIRQNLGGMSDVLSSEVGEEVQKTLGSISSVAEALGGLRSDRVVLGRGMGLGMKGGGPGGGGDTDGVPFGSGTMETGWGPGKGGGFGSGSGGPGGRGLGGRGLGGKGDGQGSGDGTGEHKVAGAAGAKAGQGLTPEQIRRVVMSRYGAFRACYESAAARDPSLQGGVTISWSVTPGGSVAGASIASSSLGNARVEGCILRQIRRLRFPTADKATNAAFPFVFKPGKK
jgi:hypothetical protein